MTASRERGDPTPTSERVVEAVAAEIGTTPDRLDPLYYTVDPESLDRLFPAGVDGSDPNRRLQFTYEGHVVSVPADGPVDVFRPGTAASDGSSVAPDGGTTGTPD
ncbi:HalOD1 output domain-containing protein [Halorarum halobium]|uniref:HalOD1 output domain-containing protein n=1 Tax=Halorarum halobium TaxID=3075121 RepID=UPI0028AAFD86|nr:HalOD1 output domain-containing protein [Halobaculum sp. XH14]